MPVMNALWAAALRRHWALLCAVAALVVFTLVHQLFFLPAAQRYRAAIRDASNLGMALDPNQSPRLVPPRLFALISQNSRPAREAQEAAGSGSLTAEFVGEKLRRISERNQVISISHLPQIARFADRHFLIRKEFKHNQTLLTTVASEVKRGEVIALLGSSGKTSQGPHLHFEVWKDGIPRDPNELLMTPARLQ